MKRITLKLAMLLSFIALVVSCGKDTPPYTPNPGEDDEDTPGYVELAQFSLNIRLEQEIFITDNAQNSSKTIAKTDSNIKEATDDYTITITLDKDNSVTQTYTYGEIKAMNAPIELMPGVYTLTAKSPDNENDVQWESPTYSGIKEDIVISKEQTTTIDDIVCKMSNIKTSVTYSADLQDLFQADNDVTPEENLRAELSIGDAAISFSRDDAETEHSAHFRAVEESNTLLIKLFGMYNVASADEEPNYVDISGWQQSISSVKAGQWRKINLKVDHANNGNVTLIVTVETWVYDERIDIDVKSFPINFAEEELDDEENEITDPLSPVITLTGIDQDINRPFEITADMFDFDGNTCYKLLKGIATSTAGSEVKSLMVEFSSTNSDLTDRILGDGFVKCRVPLYPENKIPDYITIKEDTESGAGELLATVTGDGMFLLSNYEGDHTAKIVAIDTENRESYTKLSINVDRTGMPPIITTPPTITWRAGYSFDEVHPIPGSPALPVVFDVESKSGLTKFLINITGDALPADELTGINLAANMDLINPETDAMADALGGLGFPVGDQVLGEKLLVFDITAFMPTLADISDNGKTANFELVIGDVSGTTTVTLQVIVEK